MKHLQQLDEENLKEATQLLAERDDALALVFSKYGYPPLWARTPDFSTLLHIILEQQVSLASANAAFSKLRNQLKPKGITPPNFLALDDETLNGLGFSRQKIRYGRILAQRLLDEPDFLEEMTEMDDDKAKKHLTQLTGIGAWTADIYLSECLLRPDILPKGDIALNEAFRQLKGLEKRPDYEILQSMTEHWRPFRSVGIRLLWHFYLSERR